MRLSHLKFLPCAVLIVLFFRPWLELWESDSPFSDGFASASGLQMAFGWATPCDTGDVGIPAMDDENDAFLLSVASPRRWSWSLVGLFLPVAIGFALAVAPRVNRLRELRGAAIFLLGALGIWFCHVTSRVRYFGLCPQERQYEGLFPTARAQLMGILGVSSSHRNGGDFVAPCLALEESCVIYALLAMAGILIVLVFEKRHRAKLA